MCFHSEKSRPTKAEITSTFFHIGPRAKFPSNIFAFVLDNFLCERFSPNVLWGYSINQSICQYFGAGEIVQRVGSLLCKQLSQVWSHLDPEPPPPRSNSRMQRQELPLSTCGWWPNPPHPKSCYFVSGRSRVKERFREEQTSELTTNNKDILIYTERYFFGEGHTQHCSGFTPNWPRGPYGIPVTKLGWQCAK